MALLDSKNVSENTAADQPNENDEAAKKPPLPKGVTDLHNAIKRRNKEEVLRVLEEDKQLVTYNDDGWIPLHLAVYYEFDSVLDILVETQLEIGYKLPDNVSMSTPLCLAVKLGKTSTAIKLLQLLPASSYLERSFGLNLLHLAAKNSDKEMVHYILKNCPEEYLDKILNQKDDSSNTPLHVLVSQGCYVRELIKHNRVDRMAKNNQNWTPWDTLYSEDEIIGDQVRIKQALDDTQANQHWMFWRRGIKGKLNTHESLVPPSERTKKDAAFKKAKKLLIAEERKEMKEELDRYRSRTNTQIIVTALITTVTFTVGFTMPGGYHQSGEPDQGLVLLSKKTAFNTFMVSDALALALSLTSLFIYFISSMYEDPDQVAKLDAVSTVLNIVSVIAMMLTFIAGTYVVLDQSLGLAITVCVICSIFFLSIIVLLIRMMYDRAKVEKLKV
ncbi:uncharacterized protein LOC141678125 [Apium graveolens]|uniref:uncharacterized protein LOC141678125 n=1 Tax=Apium graveolens TaxID=4045 RepID=UPI003D7B2AF6